VDYYGLVVITLYYIVASLVLGGQCNRNILVSLDEEEIALEHKLIYVLKMMQ
jgi:hypothetical protein